MDGDIEPGPKIGAFHIPSSFDDALIRFPEWGAPLCGTALRACVAGEDIILDNLPAGAGSAALMWSHRQHLFGHDVAIVDAGTGPAPPGNRLTQAENAFRAARESGPVDILMLQITDMARPANMPRGFQEALGGTCLAIEAPLTGRETLPIGADYDAFLKSLGHETRRNIRRYHRKAEAAGMRFRFALEAPHPAEAQLRYRLGAVTEPAARSPDRIAAHDAFIARRRRPFQALLHAGSGDCISLAAGFIAGESAYMVYQLNHNGFPQFSLSLTNRRNLIEAIAGLGVRELIFPNGCRGLLLNACTARRTMAVFMIRRNLMALAKAFAAAQFNKDHYIRNPLHWATRNTLRQWRKRRAGS